MTFLRLLAAVAGILYVALFAMQNMEPAELDLVFFQLGPMPRALIVLAAMAVGASLAGLALAWPMVSGRVQQRRDTRRIQELEREIHGLRTLPLSEDDLERRQAPEM